MTSKLRPTPSRWRLQYYPNLEIIAMSKKYFGTDGIRGRVGVAPITPDFMMRLGYAAGRVLTTLDTHLAAGAHPAVLIGKDTRISGYMLESALQAGLSAAGVDVLLTGPMPTPAVAHLTRALRAQAGIVISASHNPFEDNGIKFFSAQGTKLPDEVEHAIEAELDRELQTMNSARLGKARRIDDAAGRYIEFCKSTFPNALDLRGLKTCSIVRTARPTTWHRLSFTNSAPKSSPSVTSLMASTSISIVAPHIRKRFAAPWSSMVRISASPSMATATAWSWSTIRVGCSMATNCSTSLPCTVGSMAS